MHALLLKMPLRPAPQRNHRPLGWHHSCGSPRQQHGGGGTPGSPLPGAPWAGSSSGPLFPCPRWRPAGGRGAQSARQQRPAAGGANDRPPCRSQPPGFGSSQQPHLAAMHRLPLPPAAPSSKPASCAVQSSFSNARTCEPARQPASQRSACPPARTCSSNATSSILLRFAGSAQAALLATRRVVLARMVSTTCAAGRVGREGAASAAGKSGCHPAVRRR